MNAKPNPHLCACSINMMACRLSTHMNANTYAHVATGELLCKAGQGYREFEIDRYRGRARGGIRRSTK